MGVSLECAIDRARVLVVANHVDLMRVLSNLIENAIKFSNPRGTVTLSTVLHGSWVRFVVEDTGPGLDERARSQVFLEGCQADSADLRGHGLGLPIAKKLVERNGGSIGVDGEPRKGSRFYFELPVAARRSSMPPAVSRPGDIDGHDS